MADLTRQLTGYRRANGAVGIRNHVIVLPVDDLSNAAAEAVANIVPGTLALSHPYGRLQFGEDLELTFRTLIGTGVNPNVAAVVVIGIEPEWTERVVSGIAATGKPVAGFAIESHGDLATIATAARTAQEFVQDASELQREPIERSELLISIKCGESDTTTGLASCPAVSAVVDRWVQGGGSALFGETSELTGGESLIAERCIDQATRDAFQRTYDSYTAAIAATGANLLGSQPTKGNIAGGLTTIEEKALGSISKTGSVPVVDVLAEAQAPSKTGLSFMNSSSAAAEFLTLVAAGGAVLHFFPTGQGNVVGNPIEPVIKVTANPHTVATMGEHIDVDVSGVLRLEYPLEQAADRLLAVADRTINGRLTAAESLGHREYALTKLYPSA